MKKYIYLLNYHHQYHNQSGQRCHHSLFLTSGTNKQLIEHRNDNANCGYFKNEIDIHILYDLDINGEKVADSEITMSVRAKQE